MNEIIFEEYHKSYEGMIDLSHRVREFASTLSPKLCAMEEKFFYLNPYYKETDQRKIKYFREAYTYKFYLTIMHLEQLWALAHMSENSVTVKQVLNNVYDDHHVTDDKFLLPSFAMEGFIIQGATFLDFYYLHICSIFNTKLHGNLSIENLKNALSNVKEPFTLRAKAVSSYCEKNVFGCDAQGKFISNNWGGLIKCLRNGLVHRDNKQPDFQIGKSLTDKILVDIPQSETNVTLSWFCQVIHNAMYEQIVELAKLVYDLEWKAGPYTPDMW